MWDEPDDAPRRDRRSASRLAVLGALAVLLASAASAQDGRLFIGLGVMPQLSQFIGTTRLPAELYRVEVLRPIARDWRAGIEFTGRGDFAILGGAFHRDLWMSAGREWRLAIGLGLVLPLSQTDELVERLKGESPSAVERLLLRVSLGQTFDLLDRRTGLRVESGLRFMLPGSLLSTIEALDDPVGSRDGFWVYGFTAGLEIRGGGR